MRFFTEIKRIDDAEEDNASIASDMDDNESVVSADDWDIDAEDETEEKNNEIKIR